MTPQDASPSDPLMALLPALNRLPEAGLAALAGLSPTDRIVLVIFAVVYLGMFLGGLPRLKLDRAGIALLGAIAVIAWTGRSVQEVARAVDLPTLVLLFAFMVVSAQMRLGGFYTAVTRGVGALPLPRAGLLAVLIAVAAALSAVFSNDIVCLAATPVVARIAWRRGFDPVPLLVGLACAANTGSAATLIGNPQNMLIGSVLQLSFAEHLQSAWVPVVMALGWLWLWLAFGPGSRRPPPPPPSGLADDAGPPFDAWQSAKGLAVATALLVLFLRSDIPREEAALVGAAVLLLSRRLHSSHVMGFVDWQLLLLFIGLFIVNDAFQATGLAGQAVDGLAQQGITLTDPGALTMAGVVLSNLVSNVPAVMLLLPFMDSPKAGTTLALVTTFAGNLLLVGSIANLIVADLAKRDGIEIDWRRHAAIGLPVGLGSVVLLVLGGF
jgi:Na+/H+ antiporter NhaD/arsenite permease-like protein